jgi:hypothetical protein
MMTKDECLNLHLGYTKELSELYQQYADLQALELVSRRSAWEGSQHSTVTGRGQDAEFAITDITTERLKVDGQIKSVLGWLKHLELQLQYRIASETK